MNIQKTNLLIPAAILKSPSAMKELLRRIDKSINKVDAEISYRIEKCWIIFSIDVDSLDRPIQNLYRGWRRIAKNVWRAPEGAFEPAPKEEPSYNPKSTNGWRNGK